MQKIAIKIGNFIKHAFSEKKKDTCSTCVNWKAEEMNNMPRIDDTLFNTGKRYCDVNKKYTGPNHKCECYVEELFEATENSIQTEELEIDLNQEMELENNDANRRKNLY